MVDLEMFGEAIEDIQEEDNGTLAEFLRHDRYNLKRGLTVEERTYRETWIAAVQIETMRRIFTGVWD